MSEPRSSRRAKVSVNYAEPAPLSTREIRARLSQDTGEKKSRKRAPSEASAEKRKEPRTTTPAPKKPAAKKTPRRLDAALASCFREGAPPLRGLELFGRGAFAGWTVAGDQALPLA